MTTRLYGDARLRRAQPRTMCGGGTLYHSVADRGQTIGPIRMAQPFPELPPSTTVESYP